ncbi:copper transport protein ATOX1 [Pristis pectinata]|uniref:copper transport protein ATOX1 n=1 Tax=Pristis pectinata TaxID=685728 RepID=UPI00223D2F81|nr:copper transport protein ATOX1 [Pristis pectinata]XP_051871072.1 copper transport protein ATOX1 [Pristis pectinata]
MRGGLHAAGNGWRRSGAEMSKHEFFVDMTCEGCSNAVTRVLNKVEGIQFDVDLPNKKVFVESNHNVEMLTQLLKKTGKDVQYIGKK